MKQRPNLTPELNHSSKCSTQALTQTHSQHFPSPWAVYLLFLRLPLLKYFRYNPPTMAESPKARMVFLSSLFKGNSDASPGNTLLLKNREHAALIRDQLAAKLNGFDAPQILVLDLAGISFTPSALQELILPLAQRIRGGEYGTVRLVISTADPGVGDSIRYMAQAHQLPLYLSPSPFDLRDGAPVGDLTDTARGTLDTIIVLGGQVTASTLATMEGIKPSAAANRLANLDREGYLVRRSRGRRDGDIYIEPRSATATPMIFEEPVAKLPLTAS